MNESKKIKIFFCILNCTRLGKFMHQDKRKIKNQLQLQKLNKNVHCLYVEMEERQEMVI